MSKWLNPQLIPSALVDLLLLVGLGFFVVVVGVFCLFLFCFGFLKIRFVLILP